LLNKAFREFRLAGCDFIDTFQNHDGEAKSDKKEVRKNED
jgi:hypothetical protein